jgi:hypothetical protein
VTADFWSDAEVIHAYTREQAICDGVLVPLDEDGITREAGFMVPVAMTSTLWHLVEPNEREAGWGQSTEGRLWDVLNMARVYRRGIGPDGGTWYFPTIFLVKRPEHANGRRVSKTFHLKAVLGGGDDGEPVVTLMFRHES